MAGGGGDAPPLSGPVNGGAFLLKLLQNPPHHPSTPPQQHQQQQALSHDPAVAAVGPTLPFPPFPTNGHDLAHSPPWHNSPPIGPYNFFLRGMPENSNPSPNWSSAPQPAPPGFSHNFHPQNFQLSHQFMRDDVRELGFFTANHRPTISGNRPEHNLVFGSLTSDIRSSENALHGNSNRALAPGASVEALLFKDRGRDSVNRNLTDLEVEFQNTLEIDRNLPGASSASRNHEQERRGSSGEVWGRHQHGGNHRMMAPSPQVRQPPPGFPNKPKSTEHWRSGNGRRSSDHGNEKTMSHLGEPNLLSFASISGDDRERKFSSDGRKPSGGVSDGLGLIDQLDFPGPPAGSNLHSASTSDVEESLMAMRGETAEVGEGPRSWRQAQVRREGNQDRLELDDHNGELLDSSILEDESDDKIEKRKNKGSREKDYRSDMRGQQILGQRMRIFKRQIQCRSDIGRLNASFLAIYESLIPAEEEKAKQKQLLTLLEKLVCKEWPEARLYLYGSCANSFGVSKSDIDVCFAIEDADINKSDVLLRLADILQSDNLQNVQALTRARVPIVKLLDPVTGISCDICINNVLAVVNTKLLHDYARIDVRLRQLAYIVKHWAKSRGVNATYQGTLSSYAYVLMCIHFLQQRRPAILPCLQRMEITYAVSVDNVECAYFDQVDKLRDFGRHNRESIAQLVWAFFNYWAYCHDYANDVISVRTGSMLSKRAKDWTRRIGNDRHLICIEDPFEISHDLGRVVDKYSIKVLREEFERAAEILQYDPNPSVTLFERYVPS